MTRPTVPLPRVATGVPNLDALLSGGLPAGAVVVIGGPPGSGKTVLAQQIGFHAATPEHKAIYFGTLSEPTAKTLRHLSQFGSFDAAKLASGAVEFVDLGVILRADGLGQAAALLLDHVKSARPAFVIVDSFKVFDDLARSREELRKFSYEIAVGLMAWNATTLLLGEYSTEDLATNPLFSIVDGLVLLSQEPRSGEVQRTLQILKMRGTAHAREPHAFELDARGIDVYAPRLTKRLEPSRPDPQRCRTGLAKLDVLLGEGIPRGSSLLVAGVAGTGKTVLLLEFLYRGALAGERGVIFTFEETPERLRAAARGLGWDLDPLLASGMLSIRFVPQPDILVERHLRLVERHATEIGARRIAIDSLSVYLHRVTDPQVAREKVFQLATIVANLGAVGLFATDVPYGADQISRFGVEETVVDGVILLSSIGEGLGRQRYLEVYKLRDTAHLKGRHSMEIGRGESGEGGIAIWPRYGAEDLSHAPPPESGVRLGTGIPGLDALCGGGFLQRSTTLLSGSTGIGKSTFGVQFLLEGARLGERGLYVALEEAPAQIVESARGFGLPLAEAVDADRVEILYLSHDRVRASQFLAILDDRIRLGRRTRLVLDGVGHIVREGSGPDELRQLLYAMVVRFRALGVTSVLTLEASSLYAADAITERDFSPVADNIVALRYAPGPEGDEPTLSVVKTRGSAHDRGTYGLTIGPGGLGVAARRGPSPREAG